MLRPGVSHYSTSLLWVCLIGGSVIGYESSAQTYPLRHYSTADGLSHSVVRKVFQDSRGFLWFGTERGMDRYDGHEFREFLPHGRERVAVYEIWEDNQGAVWAGTYGAGLARWTLGDSMCTWMDSSRSAIGGMYVTASAGDKQRNTWLGVDEAVVLLQPDGTVRRLGAEIGSPAGEIYAIAREENGTLWIGTHTGLLRTALELEFGNGKKS